MDDPYPSYFIVAQITQPSVSYLVINGLVFILLLIGSALVSGSEVAFFSLSNEDIASIQDEDPSRGRQVSKLLETPKNLLSTILILNNLINNSFQHGAGGYLLVEFKDQSLIITDSGPGLGHITDPFSPFVKGSSSESCGLGLDISRRLSEATGIAMSYKKGAGGGACFRIEFSNI